MLQQGGVELMTSRQSYGNQFRQYPTIRPLKDNNERYNNVVVSSNDQNQALDSQVKVAPLNLLILGAGGTRGDIQPMIAVGHKLKSEGHRVRVATQENFREMVISAGLEFASVGGDSKLISKCMFMQRKGFFSIDFFRQVPLLYKVYGPMIKSMKNLCVPQSPQKEIDFKPDAIISIPWSYGNIEVAEYFNVPLHIMYPVPVTPTKDFPAPFFSKEIRKLEKNVIFRQFSREARNFKSFRVWQQYFWNVVWRYVIRLRKDLSLPPLKRKDAPHRIEKYPITYLYSSHLVPVGSDWSSNTKAVGYAYWDESRQTKFVPPRDLVTFLEAGEAPFYFGFGSMSIEGQSQKVFNTIIQVVEKTGIRAIIAQGWGQLAGKHQTQNNPNVYIQQSEIPHEWLFSKCAGAVCHGGAGTTHYCLRVGIPIFVVPVVIDQFFWGTIAQQKGVGPAPVSIDKLNVKKLVKGIKVLQSDQAKEAAKQISRNMMVEDGVNEAVRHFYDCYGDQKNLKDNIV